MKKRPSRVVLLAGAEGFLAEADRLFHDAWSLPASSSNKNAALLAARDAAYRAEKAFRRAGVLSRALSIGRRGDDLHRKLVLAGALPASRFDTIALGGRQ